MESCTLKKLALFSLAILDNFGTPSQLTASGLHRCVFSSNLVRFTFNLKRYHPCNFRPDLNEMKKLMFYQLCASLLVLVAGRGGGGGNEAMDMDNTGTWIIIFENSACVHTVHCQQ